MTAAQTAQQRLSLEMCSVRFGNQADGAGNGEAGDLLCPSDARERFRLDMVGGAGTGDAHDEVTEGVIELRDVRQHAHARTVRGESGCVHSVHDTALMD
jgi:hypothetical protein